MSDCFTKNRFEVDFSHSVFITPDLAAVLTRACYKVLQTNENNSTTITFEFYDFDDNSTYNALRSLVSGIHNAPAWQITRVLITIKAYAADDFLYEKIQLSGNVVKLDFTPLIDFDWMDTGVRTLKLALTDIKNESLNLRRQER